MNVDFYLSPRKRGSASQMKETVMLTSMTLKEPNYSDSLLEGLYSLQKEGVLCDIILCAGDVEIKAHRLVLAGCSAYFRAMLTGSMRESREEKVHFQGLTSAGLKAMADFAYTGSLFVSLDNLEEILTAATHLQISEATDLCTTFIEKTISVENCIDVLNTAEFYSLERCKHVATDFVLNNFEAVASSEQYTKVTDKQMAAFLADDNLKVVSEYKLFELLLKWIDVDRPQREIYAADLMKHIRLPLFTGEELVEKVSCIDIMKKNAECNKLLTEAKDYHIVVGKQPILQNPRTCVRASRQTLVMCHAENVEAYDIEADRYFFLRDSPVPMYDPAICVLDNFLYACGGKYDGQDTNYNNIATARCFRYDPRFDVWYELASMNEARKDFGMVAVGKNLYAIAGQDESNVMSSVERYSIAKNEWESCAMLPHTLYGHAAAQCNSVIYISGGRKFDSKSKQLFSFDPSANIWIEEPSMLRARIFHNMVEYHNKLYVIGGMIQDSNGDPLLVNTIEIYNPETKTWLQSKCQCAIQRAGVCVLNDAILIVGGKTGSRLCSNSITWFHPEKEEIGLLHRYSSRILGRSCCLLTLPQYL